MTPFLAIAVILASARADGGEGAPEPIPVRRVQPGAVTPDVPHYDLEVVYHEHRYEEGLAIARERLAADPDDVLLYVHEMRFLFELGEAGALTLSTGERKRLYQEMIASAEAGLERAPGDPHLLFGLGIGMARLGTTKGVLASLSMAKDIERAWMASASSEVAYDSIGGEETIPCDPMLCLGIFYRLIPDSWIVQVLSGTRGDLDKSLAWLQRADACAPDRVRVVKEQGVTQLCIGNERGDEAMRALGLATLERVGTLTADHPTDVIDQEHAGMLIEHPDLACGYSRDGQQERDASRLSTDR